MRGGFYLYDPRFSEGAKILCEGWAEREAVCHIILHSPPASRGVCKSRRGVPKQAPGLRGRPPLLPVPKRHDFFGGVTVLAGCTNRLEMEAESDKEKQRGERRDTAWGR